MAKQFVTNEKENNMNIERKIELVKSWGFEPLTSGLHSVEGAYQRKIGATAMNPEKVDEIWTTQDSDYINIYVDNKFCDDFKIRWSDFE